MKASEILKNCEAQGVVLQVLEGDRLRVRAPKGQIDEGLLKSIKDHKEALIQTLKGETFFEHETDTAIAELNRLGISLMDYPESTRHRAFVLEAELTEAANKGDRERFLGLLEQWRSCFI